ncbi:MAG: aminopeptidase C [Dysgonomonas sp.]
MKKLLTLTMTILLTSSAVWSQTDADSAKTDAYTFSVVKENPITSVKNQGNSGTCWSFSGAGFLESELIRMGKGVHDLSEMYIVRRNYEDKALKYVRLSGSLNFGEGGSFADVIETINDYGVLPDTLMNGYTYGETSHKHAEMSNVLTAYIKAVTENKNKRLSTAWYNGFKGILDAYLGIIPQSFVYQGRNYTPQSLAQSLGLNSDNYVSVTSFTHHPFYSQFPIEVPDNWRWANSYNVPMDEMIQIIDNAIEKGYTVAWASDVSEKGFTRNGLAVIPDEDAPENIGSDQAHWLGLSATDKLAAIRKKIESGPVKEIKVTQEKRQAAFDNYETTDDHGMQIYGIAKDQNGTKYYLVKNSWGETGMYKGIWYVSETFVKYKTISFVVNKESIPKDIAKKLSL